MPHKQAIDELNFVNQKREQLTQHILRLQGKNEVYNELLKIAK